jgi:hypothetical protein
MNIKICLKTFSEPDLFIDAVNAYRAWCESGKNHVTSQHLFDDYDSAIETYCELNGMRRSVVVDMIYRAVDVSLRDGRVK